MPTVPTEVEDWVVGHEAGELLWQDKLGVDVQMAFFDAVSKLLNVPVYRLLETKVREWCPISWFAMDMLREDWARQCRDALAQGYMSAELKARTWQHAGLRAVIDVVPPQFVLNLDLNGMYM